MNYLLPSREGLRLIELSAIDWHLLQLAERLWRPVRD
jgi:hypothetical protein